MLFKVRPQTCRRRQTRRTIPILRSCTFASALDCPRGIVLRRPHFGLCHRFSSPRVQTQALESRAKSIDSACGFVTFMETLLRLRTVTGSSQERLSVRWNSANVQSGG
jgi:hypothetical protein